MAATPPRGYGALLWNHDRSFEAEMELASWLCRAHPGRIILAGVGPSFRERFKQKFSIDVFSTPDLVYVPEFRGGGGDIISYGPPLAFDVTERPKYAWKGGPRTIFAQVSKTDELARFDKKNSYLAYKWKDGVWTFARVEDIASLKLRPKLIDTTIKGEKVKQKNYFVPRELWCGQDEFKALMFEKIRNFAPIDNVKLLREIDNAREDDMREYVAVLTRAFGRDRLREIAEYLRTLKPMIEWDSGRELEPSIYILQRVLGCVCG